MSKVQMTPEQQKKFRKCVDQGVLEALPYDKYCAITPDEAEKMFAQVADKIDFTASKDAPAQHAVDGPAPDPTRPTKFQLKAISDAVIAGEMDALPREEWDKLTKESAGKIIKELHAKRPPEQATSTQMGMIDRLVKEGRIYAMTPETYHSLTKEKASGLIRVGLNNEKQNRVVDKFDPNYVPKRDQPMTDEQKKQLKELVANGRLNVIPAKAWSEMTQEKAGQLIFRGQQMEVENNVVPSFSKEHETAPEAPSAPAPAAPSAPEKTKAAPAVPER